MPNWVDNTIVITGEKQFIDNIRNKVVVKEGDDGERNVNIAQSLFPMPQEIRYVIGSSRDSARYAKVHNKVVMPPNDLEILYAENVAKSKEFPETQFEIVELTEGEKKQLEEQYGATNWYDYNILHFGTKWADCYSRLIEDEENKLVYHFETAWVSAARMAEKISRQYQVDVKINHFSLENWEEGNLTFEKGKCMEEYWRVLPGEYDTYLEPLNTEEE
jgi:hypothetical protein